MTQCSQCSLQDDREHQWLKEEKKWGFSELGFLLVKINNVNEGFKKRQINYTESCPKYCWKEDYSEHGTDKLTQSNHLCGAELYQSTNPFFNLSSLHHSILGLHCYSFHVILIILDCSSTLTRTSIYLFCKKINYTCTSNHKIGSKRRKAILNNRHIIDTWPPNICHCY